MLRKKGNYSITYFIVAYGSESSGVARKVQDQLEVWRQLKRECLLFVLTDAVGASIWSNVAPESIVRIEKKGKLRYVTRTFHLFSAAKQTRDILYIRETFPIPYFKVKRFPKWIVEIQTIQKNELKMRSGLRLRLYKILYRWWNKKFDGIVFVSKELLTLLRGEYPKSRHAVISNGINLQRFHLSHMGPSENHPQFLFMGSLDQDWQGTDQLLELASSMPEFKFNFVGETKRYDSNLSNVIFHGFLTQEQYVKVANKCRLAFGTLNQQITGMKEASPLKVREYLALGLPVVVRYNDSDFEGRHDFLLKLPVDDRRLVDFKDKIVAFSAGWHNKRVSKFAIESLISSKKKESQRLAFFDRILD
jgi:glycosyltransferase involved in cell wall biosynthesis